MQNLVVELICVLPDLCANRSQRAKNYLGHNDVNDQSVNSTLKVAHFNSSFLGIQHDFSVISSVADNTHDPFSIGQIRTF